MSKKGERARTKVGNKLLGLGLICLLIVAAFFSGIHLGQGGFGKSPQVANLFSFFYTNPEPDSETDLTEFWRVWNLMNKKFVSVSTSTSSNEEDHVRGAIAGMVESYGDPYTIYMPPQKAAAFGEAIAGNFSGIGIEIGMRQGFLTVIAPLPDSPASQVGLMSGDIITKVDGTSTEKMSIDEAVDRIRGEEGTDVVLTIYREGETEFLQKTVTRDVINIPTLKTESNGDVFVISLYSFNALAEAKMAEAMQEYKNGDYNKLVLDLRGNPGGFLDSAVAIAGYFLESGKVVVKESFGGDKEERVYRSPGNLAGTFTPDNFVVLVDGGSASAAEILSGALSEHQVATTIGEKTFGKGSVQELVDLPDGSSLKVTIARWLTPNGVSFSAGGLEPNVAVNRSNKQILAGEDTQKAAALKWLSGDHNIADKLSFNFDDEADVN